MKAITQDRYGGAATLRLRDVPTPAVDADQILVRVAAAGVDRGAYHLMCGLPYLVRLAGYGLRAPKAPIPGTNIAGTVEVVGEAVRSFRPGDAVYGTCSGAFAEYAVTDEDRVAPTPTQLSLEESAVLPYAGAVSLQAIRDRAKVQPGHSVLVVGASGAVGTIAVQIAKAHDALVTGVCSTASADVVRNLGADQVIDYTRSDFSAGADRYDVVIDVGGNTSLSRLRRVLTPRGTLVIIGGEAGGRILGGVQRQLAALLLSPFVRQKLGTFIAGERADTLRSLNELVDAGHVRPVMERCVPLSHAADAVADLEARRTRGRIALVT
jgi:NADPH:quinone reductase-like Zn-dependent oxidoreductase